MLEIAVVTVILALIFTFTNGFQDASSLAATLIASRSATPKQGVILIAFVSFLGAILGGSAVAFTLSGLITTSSGAATVWIMFVAITVAIGWNLITWWFGLPSSSTHALIGGLIGAGIASSGIGGVLWGIGGLAGPSHQLEGIVKILVFFILSIIIGVAGSFILHKVTMLLLRNAKRHINSSIVRLNWVAAASMGFFNGANDTQKQLGIIALVLFAAGQSSTLDVPLWARAACAVLMSAGIIGGGWRVMHTLGNRLFKIEPIHSFDSQFSSGVAIAISTIAGAPVSSTQVITSSVLGVGAAENARRVKWSVGKDILIAMLVTIPITTLAAATMYTVMTPFTGV
ncbi:MAG: inorganic phosphate transporter [Methanomicrobiales archaeon]